MQTTSLRGAYARIVLAAGMFLSALLLFSCGKGASASDPRALSWDEIVAEAKGQTVYISAWAGSDQTNEYLKWVAGRVKEDYGITLKHTPNGGGSEISAKLQQEKAANVAKGSIDIGWINGDNFRVMKTEGLLYPAIYDLIPNTKYVDENNAALFEDFTIPVEGDEVPWGRAQITFFYRGDSAAPFASYRDLVAVAKAHPGRFTYPQPPDFTGLTFVKGLFYALADPATREEYYKPFTGMEAQQALLSQNGAWDLLDEAHPYFWRKGEAFPPTVADLSTLYRDGAVSYGVTFNPYYPLSETMRGNFPADTRAFIPSEGSTANAHFLAVAYNAPSKAGALVVINFMLSPEAQGRKNDVGVWGGATVLDLAKLSDEEKAYFSSSDIDPAFEPLRAFAQAGGAVIKEFHATWANAIQEEWMRRYVK